MLGVGCNKLIIANNTFSRAGVEFQYCFHASIFHNHFTSSWLYGYHEILSGWNHIYQNEFRKCDCAICLDVPCHDLIDMNNIVNNTRDVEVIVHEIPKSHWGIEGEPASEKFKDIS